MGDRPSILNRIRRLVQMPVLGELLYRINVSRPVVRMMYKGHVYADPDFVTSDHLARRMQLARRPGARFASACFVTGALDPFHDREGFLAAARRLEIPVLVIYGEHTPRRLRAEMDALAALPNVENRVLWRGALGIHEELPDEIAPLIEAFLDRRPKNVRQLWSTATPGASDVRTDNRQFPPGFVWPAGAAGRSCVARRGGHTIAWTLGGKRVRLEARCCRHRQRRVEADDDISVIAAAGEAVPTGCLHAGESLGEPG
jgi:hypothetical protein